MPEALKQAARDEAEKRSENDEEFCIVCFKAGIGWLWDMLPELIENSIPKDQP
jgi:hypothetical protein